MHRHGHRRRYTIQHTQHISFSSLVFYFTFYQCVYSAWNIRINIIYICGHTPLGTDDGNGAVNAWKPHGHVFPLHTHVWVCVSESINLFVYIVAIVHTVQTLVGGSKKRERAHKSGSFRKKEWSGLSFYGTATSMGTTHRIRIRCFDSDFSDTQKIPSGHSNKWMLNRRMVGIIFPTNCIRCCAK